MSGDYIMAVKSIGLSKANGHKPCTLESAAKHNKRELASELEGRGRIDGERVKLNYSIAGAVDSAGVVAIAAELMSAIDYEPKRGDWCQALEFVFSLPPNTAIDTAQYFADCVAWCVQWFDTGNILSADVHLDESAQHCHILIAPIQDGRWVGGKLIEKDAYRAMRESFGRQVAAAYGLSLTDKLTGKRKSEAVAMVLQAIETNHRDVIGTSLWQPLKQSIESNPAPFVAAMGLELPDISPKKVRTMAQIFTSPGKGPRKEPAHLSKVQPIRDCTDANSAMPYGFDRPDEPKKPTHAIPYRFENEDAKSQSLSCVGIALSQQTILPKKEALPHPVQIDADGVIHAPAPDRQQTSQPQPSVNLPRLKTVQPSNRGADGDLVRVRDDVQAAGQWSEELGEFVQANETNLPFADPFGEHLADQFYDGTESEVQSWQD
jgi:hypothetical protein